MKKAGPGIVVITMALCGFGCGDDGDGGAGGTASTGSASTTGGSTKAGSGSTSGGATSSSTSASASTTSSSSDASSSSGIVMCPDIGCGNVCPDGFWPELDTCPSCACEAALSFTHNLDAHPTQHISIATQASPFIGGIDRWQLGFTWTYDDPQATDEMEVITVTVRLPVQDLMTEPGSTNEMRTFDMSGTTELEIQSGKWTLFGFGLIEEDLAPTGGFISIRRNGMIFEGFASLDFDSTDSPSTFHVGGPFSAPIPPI